MEHPPLKLLVYNLLDFTQARQHTLVTELSDTERVAIGTPVHWSARDHVAHLTFWKQRLCVTLAALRRSDTPPSDNTEALNAQVFEEQRQRPWEVILLDAQQAHTDLLVHLEPFTEDDLARDQRVPSEDGANGTSPESQPLWDTILSQCFWHPLEHFTRFYLDRNDVLRATQLQQAWADKVRQPEVPLYIGSIGLYTLALFYATTRQGSSAQEALRQAKALNPDPVIESIVLYTLALFYATTNQGVKAQEALHQALALNPDLATFFKQDSDFTSLLEE